MSEVPPNNIIFFNMKNVLTNACLIFVLTCSFVVNAQIPKSEKEYLLDF